MDSSRQRALLRAAAALVLTAALPAGAQTMYRCGNAYTDQPCGTGQQVLQAPAQAPVAPPDLPADAATVEAAKANCRARLMSDIAFRDPLSVRIGAVWRAKIIQYPQLGNAAFRAYGLHVNAANAYGGYTGEKSFICLTDVRDERTVLLVKPVD